MKPNIESQEVKRIMRKSSFNVSASVCDDEKGGCVLCGEVMTAFAEVEVVEFHGNLGLAHCGCLVMNSDSLYNRFENQGTEVEMVLSCENLYCEW